MLCYTAVDEVKIVCLNVELAITQLYNGVYVGCDNCYRALVQDSNGIYCCCKHCAHKYPRANPLSSYYFRPLLMTLCDDSGELDVFVPHALVPQIVGSISATSIAKAKLSGDLQQMKDLEVQLMGIWTTFAAAHVWILNCIVKTDDNSFVEYFLFSLLACTVHVADGST
eukprot:Em0662g1a